MPYAIDKLNGKLLRPARTVNIRSWCDARHLRLMSL